MNRFFILCLSICLSLFSCKETLDESLYATVGGFEQAIEYFDYAQKKGLVVSNAKYINNSLNLVFDEGSYINIENLQDNQLLALYQDRKDSKFVIEFKDKIFRYESKVLAPQYLEISGDTIFDLTNSTEEICFKVCPKDAFIPYLPKIKDMCPILSNGKNTKITPPLWVG